MSVGRFLGTSSRPFREQSAVVWSQEHSHGHRTSSVRSFRSPSARAPVPRARTTINRHRTPDAFMAAVRVAVCGDRRRTEEDRSKRNGWSEKHDKKKKKKQKREKKQTRLIDHAGLEGPDRMPSDRIVNRYRIRFFSRTLRIVFFFVMTAGNFAKQLPTKNTQKPKPNSCGRCCAPRFAW